jgi:ATP-binding cassette subfamily B protein
MSTRPLLPRHSRLRAVILTCLKAQRLPLALAALSLLGVVAAELLAPWPLKIIFDHTAAGPAAAAWAGAAAAAAGPGRLARPGGLRSGHRAHRAGRGGAVLPAALHHGACGPPHHQALRGALFTHLQRLSLAYHRASRSGELLTKVAGDTNLLRDLFAEWMLTFVRHALTLVAMVVVMFVLNWQLALVVLATLPPLLGTIYMLNRRVKASVREQRRFEGRMTSRLNEVLSSIALVQAFGRQQHEEGRFQAEVQASYDSGMRSARTAGAISKAIAVISAAGTALTVLLGAREVLAGRLTPGELLIFMAYVASLYKPVRDLGRLSAKFSRAGVSAQRVAEILDIEPDAEDAPDALDLQRPAGEIVFEDVYFAYPEGRVVLQGLNLRIAAGERVALVGGSGAGKSTLVSLLLRLYEPTAGRILIDGVDIRRYTRASLRREIGIVPQDNMLFAVSVRENIAYGRPDAPQEAVERAAMAARAHEFIVDLPQGYDTELPERASNLSGGQRQRLCLARAFVKEPAVLVMDEPTAAVDATSARLIHEAVAHVHRIRTLLVIAHDFAEMARYDRVLMLDGGRLVEQGDHHTLMAARGRLPGPRGAPPWLMSVRPCCSTASTRWASAISPGPSRWSTHWRRPFAWSFSTAAVCRRACRCRRTSN